MINLSDYSADPIEIAQPVAVLVGTTPPDDLEDGTWIRQGRVYLQAEYADLSATVGSLDSSPFTPISFPWANDAKSVAYGDGLYVFTATTGGIITNSTIDASAPQGFAWSFNGTGDYLRADSALSSLSGVDSPFTIECWVWPRAVASGGYVIGMNTLAAGANTLIAAMISFTAVGTTVSYTTPFTVGEWQHFALSYTGSSLRVFRNGVQTGIINGVLATAPSVCVLGIGAEFDAAQGGTPGDYYDGYITNYRVTAGEALYTTTFTPPTEPLTATDYTTLLTLNSAELVDTSPNLTTVTTFGDPTVVVGNFSPFNEPDTWDQPFTGTTSTITDVIHANGSFVAVGDTGLVIESADGVTWRYPGAAIDDVYGLYNLLNVSGNTTLAAGGGQLRRSPDEIWFTPIDSGTTSSIRAVTLGSLNTSGTTENIRAMIRQDDQYVAVGGGSLIMTSTDAVTWDAPIPLPNGVSVTLNSIVYGNSVYMIAGDSGVLVTTTDLQDFRFSGLSLNPATITGISNGLEAENGLFVLGADSGQIRTSTNGLTWSVSPSTATQNINAVTFGGGQYLLGGNNRLLQTSTDAITWTDRDSGLTTTTSAINAIIYGNGIYVYGATGGAVATSTDGVTWTAQNSTVATVINDLLYAGGVYLLATNGTTANVLRRSTDAVTWTGVTFGATATILTLLYGNSAYVAGGNAGILRSSTDATTWTARTSGTASQIQAGIFGNGIFVIGGVGGYLATSTDGTTWTGQTSGTTGNIVDITYSSTLGLYLYTTSLGLSATSTDAVTWNVYQNNRESATNSIYSLAYGNGRYLYGSINGIMGTSTDAASWNTNIVSGALASAAGTVWTMTHDSTDFVYAGGSGYIATSSDATTWTYYGTGVVDTTFGASGSYINGRYVVLSQDGQIRTSTDLERWQAYRPLSSTGLLFGLAWSGSLYVLAGATISATPSGIATSTDLVTWTSQTSGVTSTIYTVTYGNGIFVFGGMGGILRTSTDGITWTARTSGTATTAYISEIIYAGGQYLYVNSVGGISTSTDAITWTARTSGTASALRRVVYANNLYIAGGVGNNLRSSTDGITWTARAMGVTNTIYGITYGNSIYVIAGQTGMLRSSTDLVTWTARTSGTASDIYNLNYDSTTSEFYYVDVNGLVGTSTDAITWSTLAARNQGTGSFYSLTYTSGTYLAGAVSGAISQSSNAETWTTQTSGNTQTTFTVTSVIYADSLYVYGAQGGHIGTSTDGVTWSRSDSETIRQVNSILYTASTDQWVYGADSGMVGTSTDAVTWQLGSPNSQYVMCGVGGMIQTSTDGITWTPRTSGTTTELRNVAYGGGQYLAGGAEVLRTSTDAITWSTIATSEGWWGLAYAGNQNLWTICGAAGILRTSTNLVTFTARTSGTTTTATLYQLQYKNNLWIHAGNSGGGGLFTSTNGITWTARTSGASGTIWSLTYGSGLYLYGDASGGIGTSTDGVTWARTAVLSSTDSVYGLAYDATNSTYIMVSRFGESGTSTDGTAWSVRPNNAGNTTQNINAVAYGNGVYVLAANAGVISSSTDVTTWLVRPTGVTAAISDVTYAGNIWTAVGESGAFFTSTDGESWLSRGLAVTGVPAGATLASDGLGVFVQGAEGGRIRRSTNAQDWSGRTTDTTSLIQAVAYGNSQWAFGTNGTTLLNLRYSNDGGNTWQTAASGVTNTITAIVYGANGWAVGFQDGAVRSTPTLTTSPTWTARIAAISARCNSLVYANSLYVAAFNGGSLYTSTNIVTWTSRTTGTTRAINGVAFGNSTWVYAGAQGVVATSTDAITWVQSPTNTTRTINCLSFGAGVFVYGADQGIIATSTDGVTWTQRESNTTDSIMNMVWDGTSALFLYSARSGSIGTSTDGITWSQPIASRQTGITSNINSVASDPGGNIVIVGDGSVIATSGNAVTWTTVTTGLTGPSGDFNAVTYGNSRWVLAGDSGLLATSTDTQTWTEENSGSTENISFATYQGNLYFYTSPGYTASSEDAVTTEYSPSYDIDTEFLVPTLGTTATAVINETADNLTPATVEIYVKAKSS